MRPLLSSVLLGLLFSTPALAARTSYTIDWTKADTGGDTVGGVEITLTRQGTSYLYSGPPVGPTMGNLSSTEDFRLDFDGTVYDFCIFVGGQNTGEEITVRTSAGSGNTVYTQTLTDGSTFTVSGSTVRVTSDDRGGLDDKSSGICVRNSSGFTWIDYDHNGAAAGLVATTFIEMDAAPPCTPTTWYADVDGDGWGNSASTVSACTAPASHVDRGGDCDDGVGSVYPGATEVVGDGIDQSCDGEEVCYVDGDGDGYRVDTTVVSSDTDCGDAGEALASAPAADCDDSATSVHPGATETVADGVDQSCDGEEICYADADEDGWRTDVTITSEDADCDDAGEALASVTSGDCSDATASVYPGATEVPYDGIDQDCNGEDWCDVDADGFDDPRCGGSDCADEDVTIHPGAPEVWYDGIDGDCDGWSDSDADRDGFDDGDDCDDTDPDIHPDAEEIWYDGVDQDCAGDSDFDQDGDGFDALAHDGTDCDDLSDVTWPGAPELADELDNDCNGLAESTDSDADGIADELELDLGLDPDSEDSDGDGVLDRDELGDAEDPLDSDGDGLIDALDADDDGDGIDSATEVVQSLKTLDSDADGTPDHLDPDSDDDGFEDALEGNVDSDFEGVPDYIDLDSDEDGVLDADEVDGDSDGDGVQDRLDVDDDGDGIATAEELTWEDDLDRDGIANYLDTDSDGDGIDDADERWADADCDGVMDVTELDAEEGPCGTRPTASFESGCSATSSPAGPGGLALGLLLLLAARRRR